MANQLSGFESAVIAAATEVSASLEGRRYFLESTYQGIEEIVPGLNPRSINIPFPDVSDWTDPGKDNVPVDDLDDAFVELRFENFPAKAIKVHNVEDAFSPRDIRLLATYMREVLKKGRKYLNKRIAAEFTSANFNAYTPISCTGSVITAAQFLQAQETLASAEVDVEDPSMMTLMIPPRVNRGIKGSNEWVQASQVSDGLAEADRARAVSAQWSAYQTTIKADVHTPFSGTAPSRTFTCALFHKWAVAVGFRPLTEVGKNVEVVYQTIGASKDGRGGIPMRFMYWYEPLMRAKLAMADFGFGLKVIDPRKGILFTVTE